MFAKLQFMIFLYQTIMKMMIILMTQKPPFSNLLRRKNAFKGIFNSWITHAIFASTYGIVVFAQFSRRRRMLETMNTKFTKKGKIPEIAINWWPYLKVCNVNSKAKLGYGALVGKKVPFRPKRSLFRSCWGMQFFYELTSPNKCYSRWKTDATSTNGPQLNFASAIILSILGKRNDALMPLVKVF